MIYCTRIHHGLRVFQPATLNLDALDNAPETEPQTSVFDLRSAHMCVLGVAVPTNHTKAPDVINPHTPSSVALPRYR